MNTRRGGDDLLSDALPGNNCGVFTSTTGEDSYAGTVIQTAPLDTRQQENGVELRRRRKHRWPSIKACAGLQAALMKQYRCMQGKQRAVLVLHEQTRLERAICSAINSVPLHRSGGLESTLCKAISQIRPVT